MKKSKTFTEAVLASVAAVAVVGLAYAGGVEKAVDLKATSAHSITLDGNYANRPTNLGATQFSDATFGLSNGGYIMIDFEGKGDTVTSGQASKAFLFSSTSTSGTGTDSLSLSIDVYANNITSASFVCGTNFSNPSGYGKEISLFANNYDNHSSTETALKSSTTTTSIDNAGISGTANHVHFAVSDDETSANGFTVYITSISFSFSC
jgi:hypothetical protein